MSECTGQDGTETVKEGDYYVTRCSLCGKELKRVYSGENT